MRLHRQDFNLIVLFGGLFVVGPVLVTAFVWHDDRLRPGGVVMAGSVLLAFALLVIAEAWPRRRSEAGTRKLGWPWAAWTFLLGAWGACTGIAMMFGAHLLAWPQWTIAAAAIPFGLALLYLFGKMADSGGGPAGG